MLKPVLYLCLVLIFSLVGCNKATDNISSEEIQSPINQNKQEIENTSNNINIKDLIEMRDSKLWINKEELGKLSLDGEPYELPEKLLEIIDFSHVIINYPLLVFNTSNVYNIEEEELIFTAEDIILSLENEWGNTIGVDEVDGFGDIEPKSFNFIDNVSLSPSKKKVAFAVHFYRVAIVDTITGVFNLEDGKVAFADGAFRGQVQDISWSPNENYFAYISDYIGQYEIEESDIYVVNSGDFEKIFTIKSTELFKEELNDKQLQEYSYKRVKLLEWVGNDSLAVKLETIGNEENVENEFTKIIKYQ